MTSLVGASVLLIAGSALALVFGWVTANESLIWTSIGASVAAGVALALAYGRARVPGPIADAARATGEVVASTAGGTEEAGEPTPADGVVGIRHTKRFHKPTCRYAAAKNAESMTKGDALARGYHACAVCKP